MNLGRFTRALGFKISNEDNSQIADGHNNDILTIHEDPAVKDEVTFTYTAKGAGYRGSWDNARGIYDPKRDVISGEIEVQPFVAGGMARKGWFSIMLDRDITQLPPAARIHVYVRLPPGPAPDEGSYTGQGN